MYAVKMRIRSFIFLLLLEYMHFACSNLNNVSTYKDSERFYAELLLKFNANYLPRYDVLHTIGV